MAINFFNFFVHGTQKTTQHPLRSLQTESRTETTNRGFHLLRYDKTYGSIYCGIQRRFEIKYTVNVLEYRNGSQRNRISQRFT